MKFLIAFALFAGIASAQAVRYDSFAFTTNPACVGGVACQVLATPGTTVQICNGVTSPCTAATTYNSVTAQTACPLYAQVVLGGSNGNQCISTTDNQGNFGVWVLPGVYSFYLTVPAGAGAGTFGPYPFTASSTSGGGGSSTLTTYLWAHFRDDDQKTLLLSQSSDMVNWTDIARQGSFSVTAPDSIRDPSQTYQNGKWYFIASPSQSAPSSIHFWSSTTLLPGSFSAITLLDVSSFAPGATGVFAPEFWHDPNTQLDYIWMPITTAANPNALNAPFTMYLGQIDLVAGAFVGTPQVVSVNGTTQHRIFDWFPYFSGGLYYSMYVDQQPTGDGATDVVFQPIAYATATSLAGPYTQQTTPGTDYFGWGDQQTEAPTLVTLASGCVRITVDHWVLTPIGPGSGGRKYAPLYKDSCPGINPLFSVASLTPSQGSVPLSPNISASEQGTILAFDASSPAISVIQTAYSFSVTDSLFNSSLGIGGCPPSFYTLEVCGKEAAPGSIQYNEAVSIGINTGTGNSGERAEISGCGRQDGSCALQFPGKARLTINSSALEGDGQVQISNSNTDLEEAGILLADGINQFGYQSISASSIGPKALWEMVENSKQLGQGNHWFGIWNGGLASSGLILSQTTGALTNTTTGCYGFKWTSPSAPLNIVGLGRWVAPGNIGNHQLVIENASGAIVAQYSLDDSTEYGVTGHYTYTPIVPAFATSGSTVYYIMSSETAGSDQWYDASTVVTPTVGTVNQAAFQSGGCGVGTPALSGSQNNSFGPLDVLVADTASGRIGGFPLSVSPQSGEVHIPIELSFGTGINSLYSLSNIWNMEANNLFYGNIPNGGNVDNNNFVVNSGALGQINQNALPGVATGTVSRVNTAVTLLSGTPFSSAWVGFPITINVTSYTIALVSSPSSLILTSGSGTDASTTYFVANPKHVSTNLVVTGDSHMFGTGQTTPIPNQVTDTFGVTLHNLAVAGSLFCTQFNNPTEVATINALFNPNARANIVVIEGGGNDMQAGLSAAAAYQCQYDFAKAMRAAGWSVVLYGMYSRTGTGDLGFTMDYWHNQLNTMYTYGYTGWADEYINIGSNVNVGMDGDYANMTYFQSDGIHVQSSYTATLAALLTTAVDALSARITQSTTAPIGAFPLSLSVLDGTTRTLYGLTLGPGDPQSLSSTVFGNVDTQVAGTINMGTGPLGDHNASVDLGSVSASRGYLLGPTNEETIFITPNGVNGMLGIVAFGSTLGARDAILQAGFYDALTRFSVNGTNGITGNTCSHFIGGICTAP